MHAPAVWLAILLFYCKILQHLVRNRTKPIWGWFCGYCGSWSLLDQLVKNPPAMRETWVGKIPWRRKRLPTPVFWLGVFHGLYSPLCRKALDRTERLSLSVLTRACYDVISIVLWFLLIVCETQRILAEYNNNSKWSHSGQCGLPLLVVLKCPV